MIIAAALAVPAIAGGDLADFKTVDTAAKTEVKKAEQGATGQTGFLGITVAPNEKGKLLISEVAPGSPAAQADIQPADQLKELAGQEVRSADEVRRLLMSRAPGDVVALKVQRKKKTLKLSATLAATSRPLKFGDERAFLGVQVGPPADGAEGIPVRRVTPGSPAEGAGVKTGDVLLRIDQTSLNDAGRFDTVLAAHTPGETVNLALKREGQMLDVKVKLVATPVATPGAEQRRLWTKDVYRLAIIGIEYPDVKHNPQIKAADWEESLFSKGTYKEKNNATGQPVFGSLNDFYQDLSVGKLRVQGKVFDWVQVSKNRSDYSQGNGTGGPNRLALLTEALDALLARDGGEALKDYDGVFFLYAGSRVQTSRGGIYWPHRATVRHRDRSLPYFIVQEGATRMTNISVMCHEFGHMLGLPDLYARPENPGSEGLGTWCLMSNEGQNGRPQHMGAWCKEQLGWLKPAVIDPTLPQKLVLSPVEGSDKECFKVLLRADGSEYLLLENRRKAGWDASLPAEGLLVWRVVGTRPILDESHGVEGPNGPRVYMNSVPYPSASNNAYTPFTTPSSRSQLGGGLPVYITNIVQRPDGKITFWVGYQFQ